MRCTRLLGPAIAAGWLASCPVPAPADPELRRASVADQAAPFAARLRQNKAESATGGGSGWWLGPAGIAAALAAFGGVSLAQKRLLPDRDAGPIRVVGRASLSPRQSVYLVRVGGRVLILGAGPQGPPTPLGEVTDAAELARLIPRRPDRPEPAASTPPATVTVPRRPPSAGFDHRIGDDE